MYPVDDPAGCGSTLRQMQAGYMAPVARQPDALPGSCPWPAGSFPIQDAVAYHGGALTSGSAQLSLLPLPMHANCARWCPIMAPLESGEQGEQSFCAQKSETLRMY